jgi:hypothetical protein
MRIWILLQHRSRTTSLLDYSRRMSASGTPYQVTIVLCRDGRLRPSLPSVSEAVQSAESTTVLQKGWTMWGQPPRLSGPGVSGHVFFFRPCDACCLVSQRHPRLAAWAALFRSFGAGFTVAGGLRGAGLAPGFPAFENREGWGGLCGGASGCGIFLKSCGGTSAAGDVTALGVVAAAGGGTVASRPGRILRPRSGQASASVPTLTLASLAGRPKAAVPTWSGPQAVPTWSLPTVGFAMAAFASAAWRTAASRARTRPPSSEYSQK